MFKNLYIQNAFFIIIVTVFMGCGTTPEPKYTIPSDTRFPSQQEKRHTDTQKTATSTARKEANPKPRQQKPKPKPEPEKQVSQRETTKTPPKQEMKRQISSPRESTEQKTGSPPDLGRRLPSLIFSEALGLYVSPNAQYDVFFHDSYWYVRSGQTWYRSKSHQGPWKKINLSSLPEPLLGQYSINKDD